MTKTCKNCGEIEFAHPVAEMEDGEITKICKKFEAEDVRLLIEGKPATLEEVNKLFEKPQN